MAFMLIAVLNADTEYAHIHLGLATKGFMCQAQRKNIKIYTNISQATPFPSPKSFLAQTCQACCLVFAFTYKIDCGNALGTLAFCLQTLWLESSCRMWAGYTKVWLASSRRTCRLSSLRLTISATVALCSLLHIWILLFFLLCSLCIQLFRFFVGPNNLCWSQNNFHGWKANFHGPKTTWMNWKAPRVPHFDTLDQLTNECHNRECMNSCTDNLCLDLEWRLRLR